MAGQTPQTYTKFATRSPGFAADTALLPLLERHGVQISARPLEEPRSTLLRDESLEEAQMHTITGLAAHPAPTLTVGGQQNP